jgi:hypothetical protein
MPNWWGWLNNLMATTRARFWIALLIGSLSGLLCAYALSRIGNGAGDFGFQLRGARDLLAGRDPYDSPPGPYNILYPLPAIMLAIPLAWLNDFAAGGVFFGISSGLLAWLILRKGEPWQLLIFLSWPFFYALLFAQWSPLVLCLYFTPAFLPVLVMKPQNALPLALTQRPSWLGIGLTLVIGIASLVIYPTWPFVWLKQTSSYQGIIPPLLTLPLGPLLLLALLRYREQKAWLLVSMAAMPQRVLYDQLALFMVPGNRLEMLIFMLCSWLSLPVLLIFGGWIHLPGGWKLWILLTLYLPALGIVFAPVLGGWIKKWKDRPTVPDRTPG